MLTVLPPRSSLIGSSVESACGGPGATLSRNGEPGTCPPPAIDRGCDDTLGRPGGIYRIPVGHGRAARIGDPAHHFIRRERAIRVPAVVDHNRVPLGRQRLRKGGPQAVSGPRHYCNSACHTDKARRVGSVMKA